MADDSRPISFGGTFVRNSDQTTKTEFSFDYDATGVVIYYVRATHLGAVSTRLRGQFPRRSTHYCVPSTNIYGQYIDFNS